MARPVLGPLMWRWLAILIGLLLCACSASTESPSPYGPWSPYDAGPVVGHCVIDGVGYGCASTLGPYTVYAPFSVPASCDTVPLECPVWDGCSIEGVGMGECER